MPEPTPPSPERDRARALRDAADLRAERRRAGDDRLQRALRTIRTHLDMDVAFIFEFSDNELVVTKAQGYLLGRPAPLSP